MCQSATSSSAASAVLDLRHCAAPEPLQPLLAACAALVPGASLTVLARLRPSVLLSLLEQRGVQHTVRALPDGCQVLCLTRDALDKPTSVGWPLS